MRPAPSRSAVCAAACLTLAGLGALSGGCGRKVGDACTANVDCSTLGDRFCDVAAPGGYCTIEGCDVRQNEKGEIVDSCQNVADESICVRFFTQEPTRACRPAESPSGCTVDERCLCDRADPNRVGACLPGPSGMPTAHCAKESSERRWCMLKCDKDDDCRNQDGKQYRCIAAGTNGAEPVPRGLAPVSGSDAGLLVGAGDYSQKFCIFQPPM